MRSARRCLYNVCPAQRGARILCLHSSWSCWPALVARRAIAAGVGALLLPSTRQWQCSRRALRHPHIILYATDSASVTIIQTTMDDATTVQYANSAASDAGVGMHVRHWQRLAAADTTALVSQYNKWMNFESSARARTHARVSSASSWLPEASVVVAARIASSAMRS